MLDENGKYISYSDVRNFGIFGFQAPSDISVGMW
jgi:hypothetical protein